MVLYYYFIKSKVLGCLKLTVQNLQGHAAQLLLTTCTLLCILLVTLAIVLPVQEKNKSWICAGYVLVDLVLS